MITLYDLEFILPGKTVSPFVMKVRLALNIKKLPHRTVWIKNCDLQERVAELGLPINTISDGTPRYKVPIIHDSATNTSISDSAAIIAYLDKTYPDTPRLLPAGSESAAVALDYAVLNNMILPIFPAMAARIGMLMEEKSKTEYTPILESIIGMKAEEFFAQPEIEKGLFEKAAEGYGKADRIFEKARLVQVDKEGDEGPFSTGKEITYADVSAGGALIWAKRASGERPELWEILKGWNGGRWLRLYEALQPYAVIY